MTRREIVVLTRVSIILCVLFLSSLWINAVLAQSRSDAVSHAEHEELKSMIQVDALTEDEKLAVMQQRLSDDEKLMVRNTGLIDDASTTINRMEGIGISFGLAITVVQFMLFRAHQESKRKMEDDESTGG